MANQPTKYSKFLVGAASAALVATAVAPVASAADFKDTKGNTHEEAINALSAAGVISGYADGTFKPNKTLTRSDVVKMMGKWLVAEGYKVPTDYKTSPRFNDLKSTSNDELLQMAALVKDNGLFIGTPDGKLDAAGDITRENMAVVLVRAFDRVHDIDLASYVAAQEFKKDVTDLGKAKAEARPAIDVLDFFDITNPAAPAFNPKSTTTRGQFASFLYKTSKTDFSKVGSGVVAGVASVKAVNATTVEVTMKDKVENVNSLNFKIDGLTVSNAAVKQTDDKVVVLTTAVQKGGEKYTVTLNEKAIGSFTGVSAVIPTKIDITTQSVQGKVGAQTILSADVGVKQAGIPVTFNVKAQTTTTLNKDQVFEAVTNADGIATFSYTQYAAGTDQVTAYPTGAPTVRSLAYVFWGVDNILTVESTDKKGNSVNNGEDKTYKMTYLDPKTGKPVANQRFFVTFAENLNVNIDKTSKATVNGVNPRQLLNNENPIVATVTTDSKGEAVFTVSGSNTSVTPVVFMDNSSTDINERQKYEADKLQAKAEKIVFAAIQSEYVIDVVRDGGEEAAVGINNGREYTIEVKTKDGKIAANEIVNVAFNEDLDRNIQTNTNSYLIKEDTNGNLYNAGKSTTVKTDSKGKATFVIGSNDVRDYATPIVWIDINSADAREGKLDEGESFKVGQISYFAVEKLTEGTVKAYDAIGKVPRASKPSFAGNETATFKFTASNQSGMAMDLPAGYETIDATFTVFNTGGEDVYVNGQVVSPNRSYTTSTIAGLVPAITVQPVGDKSASVRVVANGTAKPFANRTDLRPINLGSHTAEASFVATTSVGTLYTGVVQSINTTNKTLKFLGKNAVSYGTATYKNKNAVTLTQSAFENLVKANEGNAKVTYKKDGDNVTFEIVSLAIEDVTADYTALTTALSAANTLANAAVAGTEAGQYSQTAINAYKSAILTATTVLNNVNATQAEVANAVNSLAAATTAFNNAKVVAPGSVVITTATMAGTTLSALLGDYTYTVAGTVADATVTEVVLTFTGEDAAKTVTVPVTNKAFNHVIEGERLFGVYNKVEVANGAVKVSKDLEKLTRN